MYPGSSRDPASTFIDSGCRNRLSSHNEEQRTSASGGGEDIDDHKRNRTIPDQKAPEALIMCRNKDAAAGEMGADLPPVFFNFNENERL